MCMLRNVQTMNERILREEGITRESIMIPTFCSLNICKNLEKAHASLTAAHAQIRGHYYLTLSVFPRDQYN